MIDAKAPVVTRVRWFTGLGPSLCAGLVCSFWLTLAWDPIRIPLAVFPALATLAWAAFRPLPSPSRPKFHALAFTVGVLPFWLYQAWFVNSITAAGWVPMSCYLAMWLGVAVWLLRFVHTRLPRLPFTIILVAVWGLIEILRGEIIFHGYAWYLISYPLIDVPLLSSAARWIGAYGISLGVAACVGALFDLLIPSLGRATSIVMRPTRIRRIVACAALFLVVSGSCVTWWSTQRTDLASASPARHANIGVVQTNLPQSNKLGWPLADQLVALDRWLALTAAVGSSEQGPPDVIVWPETMKPGLTLDDDSVRAEREAKLSFTATDEHGKSQQYSSLVFTNDLLNAQKRLGIPMLIGEDAYIGLRFDFTSSGVDINYDKRFNSVFLVNDGKPDPRRYDKIRLTPFGEEMPHIDAWPWLKKTMLDVAAKGMRLDLSHGSGAVVFEVPTHSGSTFRAATPICYEITETSLVRRFIQNGAEVLIHITNDGWFGDWTIGKREHLDICRWRALEFGVPVVRSANTGISAVIDDLGRVISEGPVEMPAGSDGTNTEGTLFGSVHLRPELRTAYARTGNFAGWGGFGLGAVVIAVAFANGRRQANPSSLPNAKP